jgi:hypothetical protein
VMIVTGEAAGRRDSAKLRILLAYLMALAVPLHLSAFMAAPAAIMLGTTRPRRLRPGVSWIAALGGALAAVIGFSLGAPWLLFLGTVVAGPVGVRPLHGRRSRAIACRRRSSCSALTGAAHWLVVQRLEGRAIETQC